MNIKEIQDITSAELLFKSEMYANEEIHYAVAADLMSEVMVDTVDGSIIVTGLVNPQVIRTAEMMNVYAVLFIRGKAIPDSIIELAEDRDVTVMKTELTMFEACGKLYEAGMKAGQ